MRTLGVAFCLLIGSATAALCASYGDLNAGLTAYLDERWDDAIADFTKALAAKDLVPSLQYVAYLDRARAYAAKKDPDNAYTDLAASLALRPGDKTALNDRRLLHIKAGDLDAARQDMDLAITADPSDDESYLNRGRVYELQGDAQKELEDFQTALKNNPAGVGTDFLIGTADYQLGRYGDAIAAIDKALPVKDLKTKTTTGGITPDIGWLWLDMIALKQGSATALEAPDVNTHAWPYALVDFYRGSSSEQEVLDAAKNDDGDVQKSQLCVAHFYLGEWRRLHGDAAGAKSLFQEVADKCPESQGEWYVARVELKNVP